MIPGDGSVTGQVFNGGTGFNSDRFLFVSEDGTISGWRDALGNIGRGAPIARPGEYLQGRCLGYHGWAQLPSFGKLRQPAKLTCSRENRARPIWPENSRTLAFRLATRPSTSRSWETRSTSPTPCKMERTICRDQDTDSSLRSMRTEASWDGSAQWGRSTRRGGWRSRQAGSAPLTGDLLVGNFGDGRINIFSPDPNSPAFLGQLTDAKTGNPLSIDGLWGLIPGNGTGAGSINDIYFTAGPNGESGGVLGVLQSVPEPSSAVLAMISIAAMSAGWAWKKRGRKATT